jgi:hypothetical protein
VFPPQLLIAMQHNDLRRFLFVIDRLTLQPLERAPVARVDAKLHISLPPELLRMLPHWQFLDVITAYESILHVDAASNTLISLRLASHRSGELYRRTRMSAIRLLRNVPLRPDKEGRDRISSWNIRDGVLVDDSSPDGHNQCWRISCGRSIPRHVARRRANHWQSARTDGAPPLRNMGAGQSSGLGVDDCTCVSNKWRCAKLNKDKRT